MGAGTTKAYSICLAQKEKMQILQKEVEITLTDVKRCWGRNSMWYQVKKKPTCFSQVQIRTTHRILDCSKGIDQCTVRLWAALLSSAGSRGIWLIQERLQLTLGYFRSCERPLYSWRAWDNHFNRWHTRRRLWSCERSSRCLPWKKFWVKCPFHWLHYPCHFKCAHQSVVSHSSQKLSHFPKHSTFKSHPFVFFLSLGSNGLSSHDPFPELFVTILVLIRRPAPQMVWPPQGLSVKLWRQETDLSKEF